MNGKIVSVQRKGKKDSEFQSYTYIKNELRELGWNVKNPNRDPIGQLYTQQECLRHPEIKSMLDKLTPEYVVKLREDAFWVMEAKPTLEELEVAYEEAVQYGKLINKHKFIRAKIVTGVAGNDIDKYLVRSGFWVEEKQEFEPIIYEKKEITSILSPKIVKRLLDEGTPVLKEFDIPDELLLKAADGINKKFHEASIKKSQRATIVASMLLSLLGETNPQYNASPDVFVDDINSRAKKTLERNDKDDFSNMLRYNYQKSKMLRISLKRHWCKHSSH